MPVCEAVIGMLTFVFCFEQLRHHLAVTQNPGVDKPEINLRAAVWAGETLSAVLMPAVPAKGSGGLIKKLRVLLERTEYIPTRFDYNALERCPRKNALGHLNKIDK